MTLPKPQRPKKPKLSSTERMKRDNPICCFCGVAPTETVDHIPPRTMFLGRQFPEGFEFPACLACNGKTKDLEQAFAFYVRTFDHNEDAYDEAEFQKMIIGVRNNYPDLLPNIELSANEIRRALRSRGVEVPLGEFLHDQGVALVPKSLAGIITRFGDKLAKALYFREVGAPMPADHATYIAWFDFKNAGAKHAAEHLSALLRNLTIGARQNIDIGQQFLYRSGARADGTLWSFTAQFSQSLFIVGAVTPPSADDWRNRSDEKWTRFVNGQRRPRDEPGIPSPEHPPVPVYQLGFRALVGKRLAEPWRMRWRIAARREPLAT